MGGSLGGAASRAASDAGLHLQIGRALLEHGMPALAGAYLVGASSLDPASATAFSLHARSLQVQGLFEDAIAKYEAALAIDPKRAEAHNGLAGCRKFTAGDPAITRLDTPLDDRQYERLTDALARDSAAGDDRRVLRATGGRSGS